MERPIKTAGGFFPKMFKVLSIYFIATLSVFFGYIQFFGNASPTIITLPTDDTNAEDDSAFGGFIQKIMAFENVDTDFTLALVNDETNLAAQGNVVFDLPTSSLALDLDMIYNEQSFDVKATAVSEDLFLQINEQTYKFGGYTNLDFSSLMPLILNSINVDTSFISDIEEFLGIDFDNLDADQLMSQLKIEEKETESGYQIVVSVGNVISAQIVCDKEFNLQSVKLKDILIQGNAIKFNANVNSMNSSEISVDYQPTGAEIDLGPVFDYVNFAQNTFDNDLVKVEIEATYDENQYFGTLICDLQTPKFQLTSQVEGIDFAVAYADEKVYLDVENLKISFDVNDFENWKETISQLIETYTSKPASEVLNQFIEKYLPDDLQNFDVLTWIAAGFDQSEKINSFLPSETITAENDFTMLWNSGLSVVLTKAEDQLSNASISYEKLKLNLAFEKTEENFEIVGDYFDLSNLLPLGETVDQILAQQQFGGELVLNWQGREIEANYVVDFSDEILAKVETTAFGENVALYLNGNQILLVVGEIVVHGDIEKLDEYLLKVDQIFDTNISEQTNIQVETKQIIEKLAEVLEQLKLSENEDNLAIFEFLNNKVCLTMKDNVAILKFSNENFDVSATIKATDELITLPNATDETESVLNKIENVKDFVEAKQFAFEFALNYQNLNLSGKIYVDLVNNAYRVSDILIGNNILSVGYQDQTIFVDYGTLKFKLEEQNVENIFEIIMKIVSENEIESDTTQILTDIFGEDITALSVEQILNKLSVDIDGSLDNLTAYLTLDTTKPVSATANLTFENDNLKTVNLRANKLNLSLNVLPFETIEFLAEEYYNLTSTQNGSIVLTYDNGVEKVDISADVMIDLTDKICFELSANLFGENFEILVLNNKLFVTVGEISLETDFNNASELYSYIVETFNVVLPEVDGLLTDLNLNSFNFFEIEGLTIDANQEKVEINYIINDKLTVSATLNDEQTLSEEIVVPTNCEDLKNVLTKAKSLKDYIEKGVFEFDFDLSYNTLDFVGEFKYFQNNFEITVQACGNEVLIRKQGDTIYLSYGNMKLKFDVSQSTNQTDFKEALSTITSESLGVELDFGVFEELLNILQNYSLEDMLNKLVLSVSGSTDEICLTISNKKDFTTSQILTANIAFENNNLDTISLNLYDVVKADLKVNNVENSTMSDFDENDFSDYSTDFVDGMLNSLKVTNDVYAFGSDISIRYSKNQFYGELVVMLVEKAYQEYIPAVSLHTTSLGLNSFIYLIGSDIYVDINGLQITANLNESTINEILAFVEQFMPKEETTEPVEKAVEAFKVILPAIDQIYGVWLSNGVQFDIDGKLFYSESSYFYDIVVQALIENYQNVIVPTEIVIGANIEDPNTTVYTDYSDSWLKVGENVLENEATQKLNFATYLTNVQVGQFVSDLKDIFVGDSFKEITAVKSNDGTTNLNDFVSYKVLIELVDTIYNYATSNQYQIGFDGSLAGTTSTTTISGDVVVEVDDLPKGQTNTSGFELFDGKYLKVQGGLDITANSVRHLIDLFYESNESSALYATYTHGDYIASGDKFRAKINNANLSQIISMALAFAGLNVGEDISNALSLQPCETDFRFLQSLLGITGSDVSDDVSQVDQTLSSVENIAKIVKKIKLEKFQVENGLEQISLSVNIDWENTLAALKITLNEERQMDASTQFKLREISISNFKFGDDILNFTLQIQDFDANNFDYDTTQTHHDLSNLSQFMDVAVNTINTKGFSFRGSAVVSIIGIDAITVDYDLFVSLDDNGELYFYLELDVPAFVDVTYNAGGFGETYTIYSAFGFDNRISTLEYKDGVLDLTQNTYGNRYIWSEAWSQRDEIDAHPEATWTKDEIGSNIMEIFAYALGLTDTAFDDIKSLIASMTPNPSLEKTILGFSVLENGYLLSLDGETLTGSSAFSDLNINLGLSEIYTNVDGKNYQFIDSVSTQIDIGGGALKIPVNLQSSSGTSYTTGAGKEIYTNDYYRKIYIDAARYKKVTFKTYCNTAEFDSLMLTPGETIVFPTLTTKEETVDGMTTYYDFDGWYMDALFKTPANVTIMPDSEITFYAKWKFNRVEKTSAVNIYHNGVLVTTLRVKSGDTIDFSSVEIIDENTKFYLDADLKQEMTSFVMPTEDLNIYIRNKYTVTVESAYGENGPTNVTYFDYEGTAISLPTFKDYVVDDGNTRTTYTFLGFSQNLTTIPSENVTITANWSVDVKHYYTITFHLDFYTPLGWVNQGSLVTAPEEIGSIKVLEGTTIDLTQYSRTTVRKYGLSIRTFKVVGWDTSKPGNLSTEKGFTSFTVSGNQDLYACWEKQ